MTVAPLNRALITKTGLASTFSRSFIAVSSSSSSSCSFTFSQLPHSVRSFSSLIRLRPLAALTEFNRFSSKVGLRPFSSHAATSSLRDQSPNWTNRPPKETILLDGCDFEHWLIVMEKPEGDPTRDDIIDSYIRTLSTVLGSEEAARKSIYSVSTRCYFAFGCIISEELSYKMKELPRVRWVLPDSYLDVKNKSYGGEPFIDGQAVPYDPKYHEEWMQNNARSQNRTNRNARPRNDGSRNFNRRENMRNQDFRQRPNPTPYTGGGTAPNPNVQNPRPGVVGMSPSGNMHPNMRGMPPNGNMQPTMHPNMVGMSPSGNMHPNMGGMPPNGNMQPNGMPPSGNMQSNMAGTPNNTYPEPNTGGTPHNTYPQNNGSNMGGMPRNAYMENNGRNMGGMPHSQRAQNNGPIGGMGHNTYAQSPNMAGMSPNANMGNVGGGMPNRGSGYSNNMPNSGGGPYSDVQNGAGVPYQGREAPGGMPNRDFYQARDIPGRD